MGEQDLRAKIDRLEARLATIEGRPIARVRRRIAAVAANPRLRFTLLAVALLTPAAAYAAIIGVPNMFSNGTIADANEVNANFSALVSESNDQDARLASLEASVASHNSSIATNSSSIALNLSSISNNISNINSNTANLASDAVLIANNFNSIASNLTAISSNSGSITANASGIASNVSAIGTNASGIGTNTSAIGTLQSTFASASLNGSTLTFSGINVAIVNGSGTTDGTTNGLGNLVLGYNENPWTAARTGSHSLVIGMEHEYTGWAGAVFGRHNTIGGDATSVTGGESNTATGEYASVSGGSSNNAYGDYASVTGGLANTASGFIASVSGGQGNESHADISSILGGEAGIAGDPALGPDHSIGWAAVIVGGALNEASGDNSTILGGSSNKAIGAYSGIVGGNSNTASNTYAIVGGGTNNSSLNAYSVVAGGVNNTSSGLYGTVGGGSAVSLSSGALGGEFELEKFATSTSTGDTVPESYYLSSPPITCDATSRGRIFIGRPSANDQDSICYCGEFSGNYNVYCFNP